MSNVENVDSAGASAIEDGLDYYCNCGDFVSSDELSLKQHKASKVHRRNYVEHPEREFTYVVRLGNSADKNIVCEYIVDLNDSRAQTIHEVMEECKKTITELCKFELLDTWGVMVQIRVAVVEEHPENLCMLSDDEEPEPSLLIQVREIQSEYVVYLPDEDFEMFFDDETNAEKAIDTEALESGWTFESFSHLIISVAKLDGVRRQSYLDEKLARTYFNMVRKAAINNKNSFDW